MASSFGRLCARRSALAGAKRVHGRQDLRCLCRLTCRKLLLKIDLRHKRRVLCLTVSQGGLNSLSLDLTLKFPVSAPLLLNLLQDLAAALLLLCRKLLSLEPVLVVLRYDIPIDCRAVPEGCLHSPHSAPGC